jgi:Transglutaminase-like superfamily
MSAMAAPASLSPARKVALAAEILRSYARVRLTLRRCDLQSALVALRKPDSHVRDGAGAERLGRAVARTLRLLPTDSRCLMQSLVLTDVLARRGTSSSLVIGVTPGPEFAAHAWVEADGRPLLPALEDVYERLVEL